MRVAALYDVHGMPWALEAVLAEVGEVDAIVFGGDFVGGPCDRETLELMATLDHAFLLRGNVESGGPNAEELPLAVELDGVLYCHATPTDNLPITTAITPEDAVRATFAGVSGTVVIGHTHHQFDRRIGDLRVVNAGSVGMAYESEVAAFWTMVEDGEPSFRKTRFDVERAVAAVRESGWPSAEEFIAENLLVAVDRDEAIAILEARR
jgi:predicted phosphodiesterase